MVSAAVSGVAAGLGPDPAASAAERRLGGPADGREVERARVSQLRVARLGAIAWN